MTALVSAVRSEPTAIAGLWRIEPKAVTDERGTVREFYRHSDHAPLSGVDRWAQLNLTWTQHGAVRGLHGEPMTKLVGVVQGEAFGIYLDARADSATYGVVVTLRLTVGVQVLVPSGVCNGFQAVSDPGCQYLYCFDREWQPGLGGVAVTPLDPDLAIDWPIAIDPDDREQISAKDATAPRLAEVIR